MRRHSPGAGSSVSERGSALVVCLVGIAGMAGLSMMLMVRSLGSAREHSGRFTDDRVLTVARAGLAEAVTALRLGGTGTLGSPDTPVAHHDGVYWVDSTDLGGGERRLTVTAMNGAGRCSLEAVLQTGAGPLFRTTLFEDGDLEMQPNCFFDSFDSSESSYADQLTANGGVFAGEMGSLAANGGISIGNNTDVYGDAIPGPGESVSGGNVTGSTTPATEIRVLKSIEPPTIPSSGSLSLSPNSSMTLTAGDYHFDSIDLGSKATLTVEGDTRIVVGSFNVGSKAEVVLGDGNGPCEIYASGDMYFAPNSTLVTPSGRATDVSIYLTGDEQQMATFKPKSLYYGTVYGPKATVELYPNFELFGAVVAADFKVQPNSRFHFDESLLDEDASDGELALVYCREIEFTEPELARNRCDPLQALGLQAADVVTSADAIELSCAKDGS